MGYVIDLVQECEREILRYPDKFRVLTKLNPMDLVGSLKLCDELEEPYATVWRQWLLLGPIAFMRPDSGQIVGEPGGWDFGSGLRYKFEDWPIEYRTWWASRCANPQSTFLESTAQVTALIGANGVSKTTSLIAYGIAATLGHKPWFLSGDPCGLVKKPTGDAYKPPLRVAVFSDSFDKVRGVYFDQRMFRRGGWPRYSVERVRDSVKVSARLIQGGGYDAKGNPDLSKGVKNGSNGLPSMLIWDNGSLWQFFTYAQGPMASESYEFDLVLFDEPPPRDMYISVLRGLRESGGRALLGLTPISEPWIQSEIIDEAKINNNIEVIIADGFSNVNNQAEGWIYQYWDKLAPSEVAPRIFGRYSMTKGAEFDEFDAMVHGMDDADVPDDWPVVMGMDPHPTKPAEVCWVAYRPDGGFWVLKSMPLRGLGVKELITEIQEAEAGRSWGRQVVLRVMDPLMGAQRHRLYGGGDELTVLDVFANASPESWIWDKPAIKGPGSIEKGHLKMHELMKCRWDRVAERMIPSIRFFRDGCGGDHGLLQALSKYGWETKRVKDKEDEIRTERLKDGWWKDKVDPLRYVLTYDVNYDELVAIRDSGRSRDIDQRFLEVKTGW